MGEEVSTIQLDIIMADLEVEITARMVKEVKFQEAELLLIKLDQTETKENSVLVEIQPKQQGMMDAVVVADIMAEMLGFRVLHPVAVDQDLLKRTFLNIFRLKLELEPAMVISLSLAFHLKILFAQEIIKGRPL